MIKLETVYDVRQLLKRFGIFVYIGDRIADLELMEAEVKELYDMGLIDKDAYQMSVLILRREIRLTDKNPL